MKTKENISSLKMHRHLCEIPERSRIRKNFIILLFLAFCSLLIPVKTFSQCDSDSFLDKCAQNLGTYNYIKSFVAYANPKKKANSEFTYVFSKGSTYMMLACIENASNGKMVINLYDRDNNLIASTYDEKTNKYYTELEYPCSATGVYYIKATIEGKRSSCGLCILGFSKDQMN
jgi:hypothetical protein